MTRKRIGGVLEYQLLADLHRPDPEGLRREALRLRRDGLTVRDVAVALRLSEATVREWLAGNCEAGK